MHAGGCQCLSFACLHASATHACIRYLIKTPRMKTPISHSCRQWLHPRGCDKLSLLLSNSTDSPCSTNYFDFDRPFSCLSAMSTFSCMRENVRHPQKYRVCSKEVCLFDAYNLHGSSQDVYMYINREVHPAVLDTKAYVRCHSGKVPCCCSARGLKKTKCAQIWKTRSYTQ